MYIIPRQILQIMPDSEKIKELSLVARIGIALGLVRPPTAISTNWMTGDPPRMWKLPLFSYSIQAVVDVSLIYQRDR